MSKPNMKPEYYYTVPGFVYVEMSAMLGVLHFVMNDYGRAVVVNVRQARVSVWSGGYYE